ncbi:MAG: hypothetical protein GQ534_05160 [Candidatus Delongbacteria bacterium]|nr:hypothetical protein [Candidatus Delongbacteria bacterium]
MFKCFLIIIAILSLFACSVKENNKNYTVETINGVKTYRNKNIPSTKDIVIKPVELFTIQGADESITDSTRIINRISDFDADSKKNVYILDGRSNSMKKFDSNGKYQFSFGRRGTGPGETEMSNWMLILNDTIMYDDYIVKDMLKFNPDGKYLYENRMTESGPFERYQALTKTKIIGYQAYYEEIDDEMFVSYNLSIMNSDLKKYKQIASKRAKFVQGKYNFFDTFLSAYATSDSLIYFAEKSESKYKINVYNHEAELLYSIKKNYAKIPFNEEEIKVFDTEYKDIWYFSDNKSKFKSAIIQMEYDKYDRLWVFSAVKRDETNQTDLLVDIFKDGVFLQQVKLDICPGYDFVNYDHQIRLLGDRIYYANTQDQYMKVFEY